MPEDAPTTAESQVASDFVDVPTDAADGPGNLWLLLLFAVVAVLVAVQNLWLRRRAEREARSDGDDLQETD